MMSKNVRCTLSTNKKFTQYLPLHGVYFYVMNHYYMRLEGLTYNTMNTVIQDYNTD